MRNLSILLLFLSIPLVFSYGQKTADTEHYIYKEGSRDGIGKWYMGREIAHVMGFQGMRWLERPEREKEENTSRLLKNMHIQPEDTIADIGAGSGYHVFKMAKKASKGQVFAVDIQEEMLLAIESKVKSKASLNITTVQGEEQSVKLAPNSVDKILLVDVYHEFSFPFEMMTSIYNALRKDGKVYLIEYRAEDNNVPIKKLHKMTEQQAVKEMAVIGFKLKENQTNLPWQHCLIFVKN